MSQLPAFITGVGRHHVRERAFVGDDEIVPTSVNARSPELADDDRPVAGVW